MTDAEAITAYISGNNDAFAELFSRHNEQVKRWCFKHLQNWQSAEDVAQMVWLELSAYLKEHYNGRCSLRTLAYRIAKNRSLDYIRNTRNPEKAVDFSELERLKVTSTDRPDFDLDINDMLKPLAAEDRALILAKIEGYSDEELAASLSITAAAVKSRLFRAREIIREANK